jgi:DNA-binding MarR family transcriptional regulator
MDMEKGSLTPVIDNLIETKLLQRKRNPEDRRKVNLYLTDQGRKLVLENLHRAHQHILDKMKHLPEEEVQRFKTALSNLHDITLKL